MMSIARGAALVFTEGRPVSGFDDGVPLARHRPRRLHSGAGRGDARSSICVAHFVLTRTTFGRYVYAIGGNEEATRLSGVASGFTRR